jgi:hypothetical protein
MRLVRRPYVRASLAGLALLLSAGCSKGDGWEYRNQRAMVGESSASAIQTKVRGFRHPEGMK